MRRTLARTIALPFLIAAAVILNGCSSPLEVVLNGASDMNDGGNAAVVYVYELNAKDSFVNTPVSAFWQDPKSAVGGSMIVSHRQMVYPDEQKTLEFELREKTKFIGVAANLRNPNQDRWRAAFAVKEIGDRVTVTVEKNQVAVEAEGKDLLQRVTSTIK